MHPAAFRDPAAASELLRGAAKVLREQPGRRGCVVHLPARGRLLATGDLHDNPAHFNLIARLARLDESDDHHVFFHELIHSERLVNGVDLSHRMLLRVADLLLRHPAQVHPVLANHELAQMTGQGVSKGAGNNVDLFNDGLEFVFGDAWVEVDLAAREFLRAFPLALASESGVLAAHSVPAPNTIERFDQRVFGRDLTEEDFEPRRGAAYLMTWGRGQKDEDFDRLAEAWDVALFVLGHQHVDTGCEMRGEHAVILNSDHEGGAVLPLDLARPPSASEAMLGAVPLRALLGSDDA